MPAPDELFAMHLADMRLRGLAEDTTIYARKCAIARLGEWLAAHCKSEPWPGARGRVRVEDATAPDLLAWRAALTVSPKSVGPYVDHLRGYYAWLVKNGYRADNPAANLPVPRGHRSLPRPIKEDDLWRALGPPPPRGRAGRSPPPRAPLKSPPDPRPPHP